MKEKKISLKPSPVVIVKRLIIIELLVAFILVMAFFFVDVLSMYEKVPFHGYLSPTTFAIIIVLITQLIFLVSTFLSWFFDNYEITKDKVVHKKGVVFKKKKIQDIDTLSSITQTQGILGKWLSYGSLELRDEEQNILMVIPDVYRPKDEIENIEDLLSITPEPPPQLTNQKLEQIIQKGEGKTLEFKQSFRWDVKKGAVNKEMEQVIIKSMSAFMNTEGGRLLIGVDDDGKIVGIEQDMKTVKKKNQDGYENHLTTTFSSLVGPEFTQYYSIAFEECSGLYVCIVDIVKANEPAYFKSNTDEKFFVRAGNSTRELNVRESFKYIRINFEDYSG